MDFTITAMRASDWETVRTIYEEGIKTGDATFELDVPEWESWTKAHLPECRLVAKKNDVVIGWAALCPVSGRCVYSGVAEVSVYVAASARGVGVGKKLLQALIQESEKCGIWTLQAGIFPENIASIAIHKTCGFREVGFREKIGKMHGRWRNVILMERRSTLKKFNK